MTTTSRETGEPTDWGSDHGTPPSPVSVDEVRQAQATIRPFLSPTPLLNHPLLSARLGCDSYVKMENIQQIGAFKIRGAINLLANMDEARRRKGIVTATRGNYGAALAQACAMYGAKCTVFVPQGNSPDKNAAVEALGGEIVVCGHDFDAAWDASVRHARQNDAVSIHPAKTPELVAGQGTVAMEMLEQCPKGLDVLFVPVGGGSLAAGTVTVVKALSPNTRIIAVQAENAPAFHHAWHSKKYLPMVAARTIADGLATRVPVRYTLSMMQDLDDFVLVSEEEICGAIRCYVETIHHLVEGGGAAPLAAALRMKAQLEGKRVGLILSGSNIDQASLLVALRADADRHTPHAVPNFPMATLDYGDRS
ncbi:MAG: threonine/serine dehydratase [Gammaproteobacteria bacterium]|nr:threonine/serine dehydratase [Gammaproteobacteria bacterium]MDH4315852.1 threonine/serine dehydratase [Gammaproteobacteria bacterium]MDH5215119.1 threonine/serine dehydratase [Gammaproteobacteria bacterium]